MIQFHPFQLFLLHGGSAAAAVLPSLVTAPVQSGVLHVGEELSCTDGVYTGTEPITVGSYQWQSSADGSTGWGDITGATSAAYTLEASDHESYIRRGEVASNSAGSADRAYSDVVGPVLDVGDITFVGAGTVGFGTGAISCPWPAGHQAGDYGLLAVESAGQTVATPSGWALVGYLEDLAGAADTRTTLFERVAASGAEGDVAVADSGDHTVGVVVAYRDVASRLAEIGEAQNDAVIATCPLDTITTTTPKTRVVYIAGSGVDLGSSEWFTTWASANLTDIQERFDFSTASGGGGGIGIADGLMAATGSVGAGEMTQSGDSRCVAFTIGLVPPWE